MHHNRVIQEKSKLLTELKNLKTHCATFEPTIKQLQHKYEASMKEKMLVKLEKDKYYGKVCQLVGSVNAKLIRLLGIGARKRSKAFRKGLTRWYFRFVLAHGSCQQCVLKK
jgi:DNA repair exonuclease SbcCD ATPase subunit